MQVLHGSERRTQQRGFCAVAVTRQAHPALAVQHPGMRALRSGRFCGRRQAGLPCLLSPLLLPWVWGPGGKGPGGPAGNTVALWLVAPWADESWSQKATSPGTCRPACLKMGKSHNAIRRVENAPVWLGRVVRSPLLERGPDVLCAQSPFLQQSLGIWGLNAHGRQRGPS